MKEMKEPPECVGSSKKNRQTSQDSSSMVLHWYYKHSAHYFFAIAQDTWKTFSLMTLKRSCHVGLPQTYHDFKILFADKTCLTSKALFSADKCQLI